LRSALDIADAGHKVYVVEKSSTMGGHLAQLGRTFPSLDDVGALLEEMIDRVKNHANIEVLDYSQLLAVEGFIGNFQAQIGRKHDQVVSDGTACFTKDDDGVELSVGAIIVATGFEVFDAGLKPEYGYGVYDNVITGLEFEQLSSALGPTGEIMVDGRLARDVVFVHCVGSRDRSLGNPYCSRICCMYTAKQAHVVREKLPEARPRG
jgi:heterodisulfide reductase subunit A